MMTQVAVNRLKATQKQIRSEALLLKLMLGSIPSIDGNGYSTFKQQ